MMTVRKKVVVLGAGKVGRMVVDFLARTDDYDVRAADPDEAAARAAVLDAHGAPLPNARAAAGALDDPGALRRVLEGHDYVLSCAPFHRNVEIARAAREAGVHYLDLTEDVAVTKAVGELARGAPTAFVPQCGLAPGFVSIVTHELCSRFESLDAVKMRVGALPTFPHNRLKYNLTWSTEGLINEYCHPCEAVVDGRLVELPPLEGLEPLLVDGVEYEAFNTSGGLGTLAETYAGRVQALDYKSIRYPGHNALLKVLLEDLRFEHDREGLKRVFERSLPYTDQDVVLIYVTVSGRRDGRFATESYVKKIHGQQIAGRRWGAIQITTAAGLCAVLDLHAAGTLPASGLVRQEEIDYAAFVENRFGRWYA